MDLDAMTGSIVYSLMLGDGAVRVKVRVRFRHDDNHMLHVLIMVGWGGSAG